MKLFVLFTVLSAIILGSFAAVANIPADKTPGHPGHCNSDTTGPLNKSEEKTLKDCIRAICWDDGHISLASCGLIIPPPNCSLTSIIEGKPYPDCCPQIQCP